MDLFSTVNYRDFLQARLKEMPKEGRGQVARIAAVLQMHPTRLSQILHSHVNLTMEQAGRLANHLGLSALEVEYFLAMVQFDRAGTEELKAIYRGQMNRLRDQSKELKHRVPKDIALTDNQKAVFYSSWAYSAVRLACSVESLRSIDALADHFNMSRDKVRAILDFLLEAGLVLEDSGRYKLGPQTTHIDQSSPLLLRHLSNWRIKAISRQERFTKSEISYSCPVSIRQEDQIVVREMIVQLIEKFLKKVVASDPPDSLACLNIDWFKIEA